MAMKKFVTILIYILIIACSSCAPFLAKRAVNERISYFGHRNWIVVADSAYPLQTSDGIETLYVGGDQLEVVESALNTLAGEKHVRPMIYLDSELDAVPENDAPGMTQYRTGLARALAGRETIKIPHANLIQLMKSDSDSYRVLIIKTSLTLPYSSVFIRLDCGYWSAEAEKRLRAALHQ